MDRIRSSCAFAAILIIGAFCLLPSSTGQETLFLNDGLVAYYPFNGNVNDQSAGQHNGTVTGSSIRFVPDRFGSSDSAINFTGQEGWIELSNLDSIAPTASQSMTVTFWMTKNSTANVISKYNGIPEQSNFFVGMDLSSGEITTSANGVGYARGFTDRNHEWSHYVVVLSAGDANTKIFQNGLLLATGSPVYNSKVSAAKWFIGKNDGSLPGYFLGSLDDIRIYNRDLSETEITTLFQSESYLDFPRFADTDGDGLSDEHEILFKTDPNNPDTDGDGLSDGWEIGSVRYSYEDEFLDWEVAKVRSEEQGGHLATITSPIEQFVIEEYLKEVFGVDRPISQRRVLSDGNVITRNVTVRQDSPLIGGTDKEEEGIWKWVTGEEWSYTNWIPPVEPNNRENEDYIQVNAWPGDTINWGWNDIKNSYQGYSPSAAPPRNGNSPYLFEIGYPSDPRYADTDGDGIDDFEESQNNTDPNVPKIVRTEDIPKLEVDNFLRKENNTTFQVSIKISPHDMSRYILENSSDLKTWRRISPVFDPFNGTQTKVISATKTQSYFRLNKLASEVIPTSEPEISIIDPDAHYPFDGNSINVAGTGADGSSENIEWIPGRHSNAGKAAGFNGLDSQIIIGSLPIKVGELDATQSFSMWVYLDDTDGGPIFTDHLGSPTEGDPLVSFELRVTSDGRFFTTRKLMPDTFGFGGSFGTTESNKLRTGKWEHIVVVFNGKRIRNAANFAREYLNGELVNSGTFNFNVSFWDSEQFFRFGAKGADPLNLEDIWNRDLGDHFKGAIDDFKFYNQALSAAEVRALYNLERVP